MRRTKVADMKKLLLSSLFVAFAVAVQAGDAKTSKDSKAAKADSPCCSAKTETATKVKTSLVSTEKEKTACCGGGGCAKETLARKVFLSPKVSAELARK